MRLDNKSMDEKDDTVLIVKQQIYLHFSAKKINKHDNFTLEQNALIKLAKSNFSFFGKVLEKKRKKLNRNEKRI